MSFEQFFATLQARWKVALATLLFIVGVTLAVNLILPAQYSAVSTVVIDSKPDPVTAMLYPGGSSPAFLATQMNVLLSDRVATRVVQTLKLTDNPQMRENWRKSTEGKGDINVWVGNLLQQGLDVAPAKDSNLLTITYQSGDPVFSSTMANAFVQAYLDTFLEMRTDPAKQYAGFFDARLKQARLRLEEAQTKLSAFQREKGLVVTNERMDIETARLAELSSQLVSTQAMAVETNSRRAQANSSPETSADVINHPIISSLRAELLRQETALKEMSDRLGTSNPQVTELNTKIASLRASIASESRRIQSSMVGTNAISDVRVAELKSSLEAQRAKLLAMRQVRDEAAVLERDVQSAQQAYDVLQGRVTATSIESQATLSNVYVLTRASEPTRTSSPKIMRNTLIALCGGLLIAVAVAFAVELFDRRVRTVEDLVIRADLPVLGVLPGPDRAGLFRRAPRLSLMQERVVGALSGPVLKGA